MSKLRWNIRSINYIRVVFQYLNGLERIIEMDKIDDFLAQVVKWISETMFRVHIIRFIIERKFL